MPDVLTGNCECANDMRPIALNSLFEEAGFTGELHNPLVPSFPTNEAKGIRQRGVMSFVHEPYGSTVLQLGP